MNGQLNVTPIESKQPQPQCRFKIDCVLRGFPIVIEGEGRAADLKLICDRLLDMGAEPPNTKPEPTKSAGVPTCPVHHKAMKPSRKPGKFYCAQRAEGGEYCRETA